MDGRRSATLPVLVALGALALAARLPGLDRSLWYDELFTLAHFADSLSHALGRQIEANNHPLASLLAWLVGRFSDDEVALRLPFVCLGALGAPALAWALEPVGRRAALLAGGLYALAPAAVLASQQVRGYAGLLLCSGLVLGFFLRADSRRAAIGLSVSTAVGLWFHATLLAALAPLLLLAVWERRRFAASGVAAGTVAGLLLYLPILTRTLKFVRRSLGVGPPAGFNPGPLSLADAGAVVGGGSGFLLLALSACAVWGAVALLRSARDRRAGLALLAPLAGALALLPLSTLGYARFLLFALPAFLALAAIGLTQLRWRRRIVLGLTVCLVASAGSVRQQSRVELQDLRGALRVARECSASLGGAPIVALGPGGELCARYAPTIVHDPSGGHLTQPGPLVCVVTLPAWLNVAGQVGARLRGPGFADPLLLPGREGAVLVFTRRE